MTRPSSLDSTRIPAVSAWLVAARPRSLPVAISPVVVGVALAWLRTGTIDLTVAGLILAASLLIQVITNLQNDVGYTARGGERSGTRTGLPRATANGWLSLGQVRLAIVLLAIVATVLGLVLTHNRGWPVLVIGVSSLLAALAYMGGPRPIAYSPFGELTVFVFFGLVAVIGTEWALTGDFTITTVLAAIGIGGLAAAALAVNNHRDIAHDKLVGRRTFAVLAGTDGSRRLYAMLLFGPFLLVPFIALSARAPTLLLPLVLLASAPQLWRDFVRCPPGVAFNDILHRTFRLELTYACLLAVGAVLGRLTA